MSVADMRKNYTLQGLIEADVDPNPFKQFQTWFDAAITANLPEPNALTLATASRDGRPSARVVLLKGFDERGFVFYTNYESRKGRELDENPFAAMVFLWDELERQVRIEGAVERVSADESDDYFNSRPWGSRLGAWASKQSTVITGRDVLDQQWQELTAAYEGREVPRPPHWGGYRVIPQVIEFWQGRPSRLHDRLRYTRQQDGAWVIERLSP
jgi:pyridoxamine 5'-phosphate oxidase